MWFGIFSTLDVLNLFDPFDLFGLLADPGKAKYLE